MNIVIPMAGKSSRFFDAGFTVPKYMLPLSKQQNGIAMIQGAVDSLHMEGQLIFIVQRDHSMFGIDTFLKEKYPDCIVLYLERYTGGCVESVYEAAKAYINNDKPLVISNCDQYLEWNSDEFLRICNQPHVDGCVLTYFADTTKNSYCTVDTSGKCTLFKEKEVISPHSLVGVHYWKRGSDFVSSAEDMIQNNVRDAGEYYVSTSYNYLVKQKKFIAICPMREGETYHTIGVPETYYNFLQSQDPIQISQLTTMKRGWFLGDFLPCAYSSKDVEVGILEHKAGEEWPAHIHKKGDEINVLLSGSMQINTQTIHAGQIFVIPKGHLTKAIFFEDCRIVCVKLPSDTKDKYCY
jgi:mannose-6-phosphate isomerase-like protein (cupin superfamily)/CTP:phosphocholine cytidylyltransferase-like protein